MYVTYLARVPNQIYPPVDPGAVRHGFEPVSAAQPLRNSDLARINRLNGFPAINLASPKNRINESLI
jgi:hypothetical protein